MTARKPRHEWLTLEADFAFQIPGWPTYGITTCGRVRRLDTGRWLTPCPSQRGNYLQVSLWQGGKGRTQYVHQLVAVTFHGPRPTPKHDAAHTDGDKENNHFTNIRWATRAENEHDKIGHGRSNRGERNGKSKLCAAQIGEILLKASSLPRSSGGRRIRKGALDPLAAEYGVSANCLRQILSGQRWTQTP